MRVHAFLLPFLLTACGSSSTPADLAAGNADLASVANADLAGATIIEVSYMGTTNQVSIGGMTVVAGKGVSLAEIARAGSTVTDLAKVTADFMAVDGFMPGQKANCAMTIPAPGANLEKGWVDPATRLLTWADDLGYPGCMTVKQFAKLILADK